MKTEKVLISSLMLDPANVRIHSEKNLKVIAASLEKFGQRKPIVVHNGTVIAGNGTLEAARTLLGWTEIDVTEVPSDWTSDTATAYALTDNQSAILAEWDMTGLGGQLLELAEAGFDIEELGFEMPQVVDFEPVDEEIPAVPAEPTSKLGDLWILGPHRVLCGDATIVTDYAKLMGEEKADLIWTDPPYGVSYVGKTKDALTIQNDRLDIASLEEFLRGAFTTMFTFTNPGACWYVAAPSGNLFQAFSIPLSELEVWRHTLVWVKDTLVMGRADYHYRHESIFYGWTPGAAHQEPPNRKQDTVWEIPRPKASKEHPTMKPIELIERAVQNSSLVGQIVLDPFAGSGSTLIACEQTKRVARVIELDPRYVDVVLKRWVNLTGGDPEREDGVKWSECQKS